MRYLVIAALLLAGCATAGDFGREPAMSPVGAGLYAYREPLPTEAFPGPTRSGGYSIWNDTRANLFQDPRASTVGDIITVIIRIDDKASLDNESSRERDSAAGIGGTFDYSVEGDDTALAGTGSGRLGVDSDSSARGRGSVDRSEKIDVSIAAVVTEVLPNGNLVINGSQEVRVNFEMRILNITGIVRPRDISTRNTIFYERVAEARISYGGRGRISEVQQPRWGQQLYDAVTPF
jgi:flagellar L-ring protein precursor FlgH